MRFKFSAAVLTMALLVAPAARAACNSPLPGPGAPLALPPPSNAADREAISAGVYLALSDDAAEADWAWRRMEAAPPCPVSSFKVEGVTWEVSGGEGAAPLRWARSQGSDVYYFLVQGPSPAEARAWAATRRNGAATGTSATYLVASDGGLQFVMRIYDGAPDARRLADDLASSISGRFTPLAVFDPTGDAVTLDKADPEGIAAELFRPALIGGDRHATLLGPDGHFFAPAPEGGVRLRGSGLFCGDVYGPFERTRLTVLRAQDEDLDLGCSLHSEESWISIFSTRRADTRDDKAIFRDHIRSTQADTGVKRRPVATRGSSGEALRAGAVWVDKNDMGQGLWFVRMGEYVVEFRATFRLDETDAVYDALTAFVTNTPPAPPTDQRG
ncbi:MAG: hypothetical protein AB1942_22030 [Pseudomonadota bacterium]